MQQSREDKSVLFYLSSIVNDNKLHR